MEWTRWMLGLVWLFSICAESLTLSSSWSRATPRGFTIPGLAERAGSGVPNPDKFISCVQSVKAFLVPHNDRLVSKFAMCDGDFRTFHFEPRTFVHHPTNFTMYSPSDILSRLANRRVVILGDSTSHHTWVYLGCFLHQGSTDENISESSLTWASGSMHLAWRHSNNVTLEFVGGGRGYEAEPFYAQGAGPRPNNLAAVFPEVLGSLGSQDAILVNSGIHDNTVDEITDDRQSHGEAELGELIPFEGMGDLGKRTNRKRTKDALQVAHAVANSVRERRSKDPSRVPTVVWRETSPTHFQKSDGPVDGLFPLHPRAEKAWMGACVELDHSMLSERSAANTRNLLSTPVLEDADVPVLKLWRELVKYPHAHQCHQGFYDCTHWKWEVNRIILQGFFNILFA